jgi:hypothetical protein
MSRRSVDLLAPPGQGVELCELVVVEAGSFDEFVRRDRA